jgi:hypothetical protein
MHRVPFQDILDIKLLMVRGAYPITYHFERIKSFAWNLSASLGSALSKDQALKRLDGSTGSQFGTSHFDIFT